MTTTIRDRINARELQARMMLVERADVSLDELRLTAAVLSRLGAVEIDDLVVSPGFNLLPDGSVGSANTGTPEWRLYAELGDMVDNARRMGYQLGRAESEARERQEQER
ncbi:hypothetical protein PP713_14215 [Mycobacterium sp. CSUR Q5927]|nr:hypothetical protein [Mycobacterium sp. CSUR Q5927]